MAKTKIHTIEIYQDTSTGDKYQQNPDGTFTQISTSGAALVSQSTALAGERTNYAISVGEWNYTSFNPRAASIGTAVGAAGAVGATEVLIGAGAPVLVGGVYFESDSTAGQSLLLRDVASTGQSVSAKSIGASTEFDGLKFNTGLTVCGTAAGVSAIVKWRPQ